MAEERNEIPETPLEAMCNKYKRNIEGIKPEDMPKYEIPLLNFRSRITFEVTQAISDLTQNNDGDYSMEAELAYFIALDLISAKLKLAIGKGDYAGVTKQIEQAVKIYSITKETIKSFNINGQISRFAEER